jgi:hypothetical protein
MNASRFVVAIGHLLLLSRSAAADTPAAENRFAVSLPKHRYSDALLPGSPFGINTALRPDAPDLPARLKAMQQAGIKWGRQDFTWKRIEREPGQYDWEPYDRLVDACRKHGILLSGNLAYGPGFHDPRTRQGAEAYAAFGRAAARRYRGKVDHWQIWNEPNWGVLERDAGTICAAAGDGRQGHPRSQPQSQGPRPEHGLL